MFKTNLARKRFEYMHPLAAFIAMDIRLWAIENGFPFLITETVSTQYEDHILKRKSNSHLTGRAFDLSLRGWNESAINECVKRFNEKYDNSAAYSRSSNAPKLIVDHFGTARHFHVQIHSRFSLNIKNLPLQ